MGNTINSGQFSQFLSWRWILFDNVPLCLIAEFMIYPAFHETITPRRHRIDFLGAGLLAGSLSLLILAVLEGGQAWAWKSSQSFGAFAVGGVLLGLFAVAESRAEDPIVPHWVFSRRLRPTTLLISLGGEEILIGLTS